MSFNLLKFKKNQVVENSVQEVNVDYVFIGLDLNSMFELYQDSDFLQKSFLILDQNERTITEHINLVDQLPYPWTFKKNIESSAASEVMLGESTFFKDGEFRSLRGRHKMNFCHPYLLKFLDSGYNISWSWWWENKLNAFEREKINSSLVLGQVKEVFHDGKIWLVKTYDNKVIKAKILRWNLAPELFLKLFKYQEQYPKNFLTWSSSFVPLNFLLLQVKINSKTLVPQERVLIPLTMGTDEGYFLLSKSHQDSTYNMLYLFKDSEIQEEDVANRIRLIKKQVTRIFNVNENNFEAERIFFLPQFTHVQNQQMNKIDDFVQPYEIFKFDNQYFFENKEIAPASFYDILSCKKDKTVIVNEVSENSQSI